MTNASGKTGIQPNNFISGLFNGDLFKKQTFSLSEVLSTSDVDAIKAYNKQIDKCVTSQTAFNRTMLNTSKEAQNVVAAANGNKVALDGLTKSSKAAELGMKALAMAGNMLLIYALTSAVDIIYKCATASDRLAESAAQMGSEFASTKSDISDYKAKIEELYQTINDDTSSYEDTYNARQELLKIQDEMIDKFGDEADAVKLVTDAINGQTDSLDTLTQDKWQETVNAFNSDRGKGWTEKVADAFANIGHGNNFQRMIDEMEDTEVTFHMIPMYGDDTYEEFSKKLKEDFGADITRTERDDAITLSGDLDTIYKQLLNIQTLAKGMGIDDTFLNDLGNQADEAKSKLDEYQEMYSQHVLYDKIFNSEDYEKSFDEINKAYEKYQDAFASGDEESIEKAKQNYAEIVQSVTEGLDDQSVIDYFNSMYPDLQEIVGGWNFEVKFKAAVDDDNDDFEKGVQDAVNKFDTVEDIKNYNPKVATDEQKDAYLQLKQYADDYGLTLDQLIDKLVQLGLLQSQSKSDLLNKLIPSKSIPTAGVTSALTDVMDSVDADEVEKWVNSLIDEEAKLANSPEFDKALEKQKEKINSIPESFKEAQENLENEYQKISDWGLDDYADQIKNGTIQSKFGNVDMDKRTIIHWSDELKQTYADELASWDYDPEVGSIDTVFGGSQRFGEDLNGNGWEIAFTPILPDGTFLSKDTVEEYINSILAEAYADDGKVTEDELVTIDTQGRQVGNTFVQGIFAGIDDSQNYDDNGNWAEVVGRLMHFSGDFGAIKLANDGIDEVSKSMDGGTLSAENYASALEDVKNTQEKANETPISSTDILAQVQALSDGLDQLDKIYADVYNKEDFDWSSILNNGGFKEAFGNMTNVTEEYKNAYDDFIKTISNNPSDLSACQSAFDNLATAYIYNSDALKNVTEDTKASTIAMLEQMGIANAEEVVTAQIANNLLEARAATLDFASATDADINSLVAYANQLGLTAADVAQLCLKQIDVSNNPIKTQASLANLQSLISMAGVTGDKLTYLLKMINAVNNVASLAASGKATQSQITAAGRIVENLQGQMKNISTANVKPSVSYSGGTSTKSAIDKANKSSGGSSKDSKETKETFNWVETVISRIQRAVTNLGKTVSATYKSWSTRNSALSSEMSAVTQEISVQQSAYQAYMDKANSVGLSDYYKNLVQNGGMSIEDVTDDTLKEQIQTYKEYYEKALAASDAVQDLRDNLAELAKTKFDNLAKKFENELDLIEHKSSMLDKYIDQTEKKGEIVSEHFYTTLIQNEQANVDKLQNEYNSLFNQLQDSLSTGGIEVYSDDWYEMVGQINDVEEALVDANSALVDYEKSLLKLRWDNFDYLRDCISDIISETEFLADLLDNKKLFDDSGHLNNYGESLGALYAIEYNTYMNQADEYAKAIDELNKAIAANPNDKDLLDRRQELYDAQREVIKNAESEKDAIKDLISDAYDAQLEALQKLIDKRKELLDATSDLYEYENTISEKTDTIASYQKQLQAYQGDNSEEGIANRQKIQTELEKAKKDLQQTEYEKWKSDQTAMLDDLYSEYETMLNSRLDDIDALVQDVINQSNANSVEIQGTIIDVANQVGYNISSDLQTILDTNNGMYDMVAFYNENFTGLLTTTNMSINGVTDRINAMISYSDSNAVNIINSINTAANNIVTASLQAASVYSSTIASLQSQLTLATITANNNSSNHSGGSSGSSRSGGSSSSLKPGKTGGTIKKPHRTITSNSGATTHPMYNIATRYAKGGNVSSKTKSPFDDLAQSMGEDTMVAVKEGERILTPVQNEMWEQWTASLPKLMDLSDSIKIPDFSKNVAQNATQSNINIGIDNIQMNGVNDPEKFTKQLVESVQRNGKVQSVLKDLTSNALLGKNSLRINKY